MVGDFVQHCDSTCFHCAQTFFLWLKTRMHQMSNPVGKRAQRSGSGNFAESAATSVKAPKAFEQCHTCFEEGDQVTYNGMQAVVLTDMGYVGLHGKHMVRVRIGDWCVNVPCGLLK